MKRVVDYSNILSKLPCYSNIWPLVHRVDRFSCATSYFTKQGRDLTIELIVCVKGYRCAAQRMATKGHSLLHWVGSTNVTERYAMVNSVIVRTVFALASATTLFSFGSQFALAGADPTIEAVPECTGTSQNGVEQTHRDGHDAVHAAFQVSCPNAQWAYITWKIEEFDRSGGPDINTWTGSFWSAVTAPIPGQGCPCSNGVAAYTSPAEIVQGGFTGHDNYIVSATIYIYPQNANIFLPPDTSKALQTIYPSAPVNTF